MRGKLLVRENIRLLKGEQGKDWESRSAAEEWEKTEEESDWVPLWKASSGWQLTSEREKVLGEKVKTNTRRQKNEGQGTSHRGLRKGGARMRGRNKRDTGQRGKKELDSVSLKETKNEEIRKAVEKKNTIPDVFSKDWAQPRSSLGEEERGSKFCKGKRRGEGRKSYN